MKVTLIAFILCLTIVHPIRAVKESLKAMLEDSISTYDEINKLLDKAKIDKSNVSFAIAYHQLARYNTSNNQSTKALKNYFIAQNYALKAKDDYLINLINYRIGSLYSKQKFLHKEAEQMILKTLKYFEKIRNYRLIVVHKFTLANLYLSSDETALFLKYMNEVKEQNKTANHPFIELNYYNPIIHFYRKAKDTEKTKIYADSLYQVALKFKGRLQLCMSYLYFGDYEMYRGRYPAAIGHYFEALSVANEIKNLPIVRDVYKNLWYCYDKSNDFKKAVNYANKYYDIAEKLNQLNDNETINFIKEANEKKKIELKLNNALLQKQQAELLYQKQQSEYYFWFTVLALLFVMALWGTIFYWYKQKQKSSLYERTLENAKTVNELNVAKALLQGQEEERERVAGELHDSVGGIIALIQSRIKTVLGLEIIGNKYVKKEQLDQLAFLINKTDIEIRNISRNLQPATLKRFGLSSTISDYVNFVNSHENIVAEFHSFGDSTQIPEEFQLSIFRIVQESISNAIKHGKATEVLIQLNTTESEVIVEIEDNGLGFDNEVEYAGMGLRNIKMRTEFMNATLSISSNKEEGTAILLQVPLTKPTTS